MRNVLITGANGQLGTEIGKILPHAVLTTHSDLDITNEAAVHNFVNKNKINTIVNCAAYTAVDAAEDDSDAAFMVNMIGPRNLARTGCKIIQISTDYVFNGELVAGSYQTSDEPKPISVYGLSKLFGEFDVEHYSKNYAIIRTSWLYSPYGKNFVKTMRKIGATKPEVSVVNDQYGLPTYAADLAAAIVQIIPMMQPENAGIYHYCNTDVLDGTFFKGISWYDFATEIMKQSNLNCVVKPISTQQYPTRAIRPKYSVMDTSKIQKTFGIKIPVWKDALHRCINEIERR